MPVEEGLYGLLAEFNTPLSMVHATEKARDAGYRRMECYTPYPVEEAANALDCPSQPRPPAYPAGRPDGPHHRRPHAGLDVQISYPLNIAGRPLFSWPAFIIPAYEWTILFAGLSAAFSMLALNGLPQPYHPLFNAPNFRSGATDDKFFLCLEATTPASTWRRHVSFLEQFHAVSVVEVDL